MAKPYQSNAQAMAAVVELARGRCELLYQEAPDYPAAAQQEAYHQQKALAQIAQGDMNGFAYLAKVFNLSLFEQHCFRLALAVEIDGSLEGVYADLQDKVLRLPTLALCLQTFTPDVAEQVALRMAWKLRQETLAIFFELGLGELNQQSDTTVGLKLARRVTTFCFNPQTPGNGLPGGMTLYFPQQLPPLGVNGDLCQTLSQFMAKKDDGKRRIYHLHGDVGMGKTYLMRHLANNQESTLQVFHLPAIFDAGNWKEQVQAICREVAMNYALVAISAMDIFLREDPQAKELEDGTFTRVDTINRQGFLRDLLLALYPLCETVFFLSVCPWDPALNSGDYQVVDVPLTMPDGLARMALMEQYFAPMTLEKGTSFEALASKFTLNPGQIAKAAQDAQHHLDWTGESVVTNGLLHRVCRDQLAHGLGKMATLVPGVYHWEDLILPPKQKRQLQSACAQVEHRHQVYYTWGFDKKRAYGKGLSMLFTGPPGTGKTMAAQVVANRLHLDLYKVDVSSVLSKYIGETEKQLGKVFDEVKKSQSILFFDEADAMFGKRSETKDAHDKYANVQTSYLLQKMEEYDGIVVLASNYLENFDEAFKRRITYIIDFTLPDADHRLQIWQSVLPPDLPLGRDMDIEFLARSFELSGSSIKNIALSAAFMAADAGEVLSMTQVLLATREEQQKAGKTLHRDDFGEYYPQIEGFL